MSRLKLGCEKMMVTVSNYYGNLYSHCQSMHIAFKAVLNEPQCSGMDTLEDARLAPRLATLFCHEVMLDCCM